MRGPFRPEQGVLYRGAPMGDVVDEKTALHAEIMRFPDLVAAHEGTSSR